MDELKNENVCPHCGKKKERGSEEYQSLINRLNRIEGQVRGIRGMVEKSAYCTDIIIQVAAVNAALNSFNRELLKNHILTCVAHDLESGDYSSAKELADLLPKILK